MIVIKSIVALIWGVLGLFIWIPILTRVMVSYISTVCFLTILEKDFDVKRFVYLLSITSNIYLMGFENIFSDGDDDGRMKSTFKPKDWDRIWLELAWSAFFWGVIALPLIF